LVPALMTNVQFLVAKLQLFGVLVAKVQLVCVLVAKV
jgi:hypothetical protein